MMSSLIAALFLFLAGIGHDLESGQSSLVTAAPNRVPKVLMLRRQIRNYVPGRRATITIVYQASDPLILRWFRHTSAGPRAFSEIPDMLPALGDLRYGNSTIYAGNVVATTLVIKKVDLKPYPAKYTLIISGTEQPFSYHVDTKILKDTAMQRDKLEAMYWTSPPQPTVFFGYGGHFSVSCTAMLDRESDQFLDELTLFRTLIEKPLAPRKRPTSQSLPIGRISVERGNYREHGGENQKYLLVGRRTLLDYGYAKYHVGMKVSNASRQDQGMYACHMERSEDRMFVSSWIQRIELLAPPIIDFLPCEAQLLNERTDTLSMVEDKESCFRCRSFGYPYASMTVLKDGWPLAANRNLLVETHLSVAEGGLSEVSVTFLHPTSVNSGRYECKAENDEGQVSYKFQLSVVKY